jgi:hypothetical protein
MTNEAELEIPEHIAKRRKRWLIVTLLLACYPTVIVFLLCIIGSNYLTPEKIDSSIARVLANAIVGAPFVYLLYYCAYKKFGNVYLVICMLGSAWTIIELACSFTRELHWIANIAPASSMALSVYWLIVSKEFFKLNQICRKIKGIEYPQNDSSNSS